MQKNDMQPDENPPIGLLLCRVGYTEHIELMVLDEDHIRVAQYLLTCLPDKQSFIPNRSLEICKPAFLMTVIRKSSSYIAV